MSETTITTNGDVFTRKDPLVSIAAIVCTFVLLIVVVLALFAKDQLIVAAYIAGALGLMGVALGLIATRKTVSTVER